MSLFTVFLIISPTSLSFMCLCVTALYLGVSMSVYQSSSSLAVQLRLEVIPINV